jgi:small subunit ribosomal protein S8
MFQGIGSQRRAPRNKKGQLVKLMTIDQLSNMLSSIKNAAMVGRPFIEVVYTKENEEVAKRLKEEGFLKDLKVFKESGKSYKMMRLDISYDNGIAKISDVRRISKPGRRVYKGFKEMPVVAGGYGVLVVSTSRGILTGKEAKKRKLGGELICEVK